MIFPSRTVTALALVMTSGAAAMAFPATSTSSVNVRSGPGTNYAVIDTLQAGQAVDVTATQGNWYQVDGQGWASASYLASGGVAEPVVEYGYPAFYYGDDPYYWDNAGYYWFWSNGIRRRVAYDWWRNHHNDIRWDNRWRHRDWRGPGREARIDRRVDRRVDRADRRIDRVDRRVDRRADRQISRRAERPQAVPLREGRASAAGGPGRAAVNRGSYRGGGMDGGPRYYQGGGHMGGGRMGGGHFGGGGHMGGRR